MRRVAPRRRPRRVLRAAAATAAVDRSSRRRNRAAVPRRSNATPGTRTKSIVSREISGQADSGSGMSRYPATMSRSGSAIAWSSSIRVALSTRGTPTVLPAASAARTSGERVPLAAERQRQQHDARGCEIGAGQDAPDNGGGRGNPLGRREGVARCQHALPQRALRRAQRRTLQATGVNAIGRRGHGPMLSHRGSLPSGGRGPSLAQAL